MRKLILTVAAAALQLGAPCAAELREVQAPATATWKHEQTGLMLKPILAGMNRSDIADTGEKELDIVASYKAATDGTIATIFLFKPWIPSAPLWFDRSSHALKSNPQFGVQDQTIEGHAFAPPNSRTPSALSAVYPLSSEKWSSTALAVIPLGDWLVSIRISSPSRDALALGKQLDALIADIGWPAETNAAPAAALVKPCANPLKFGKASPLKPDATSALVVTALLAGAMNGKAAPGKSATPSTYCVEAESAPYGVYRADAKTDGYVIAGGDAGRTIAVSPAADLTNRRDQYAVTFQDLDAEQLVVLWNKLPRPEDVISYIFGQQAGGK